MHRLSIMLLTLGGLVLCVVFFICSGLRTLNEAPAPLVREVHARLHAVVESPLLTQEDLGTPVAGLEGLNGTLARLESRVKARLREEETHRQALLLEEGILGRLRELVQYRKSCERSLHSALNDPLTENPLAASVETSATPLPSPKEGMLPSPEETAMRQHVEELRNENRQRLAEDTKRRRTLFAEGAKVRWADARRRVKVQVGQDLQRLDLLMASAVGSF